MAKEIDPNMIFNDGLITNPDGSMINEAFVDHPELFKDKDEDEEERKRKERLKQKNFQQLSENQQIKDMKGDQ